MREGLYSLVASAEQLSEHPLGRAVVECARNEGVRLEPAVAFEMVPGQGVRANVGGHTVAVGNAQLMGTAGVDATQWGASSRDAFLDQGRTVALVGGVRARGEGGQARRTGQGGAEAEAK